ncbi:LysR family transcriptional regulator [Yinghuangia seranimata]|uniref:LysR family transcriptional regulator n=1 Tax=Yinghuangia seranimata TaxID=408067 RepID=UPI00248C4D6D|nr:LysR family transcriptional regulator [Yinghuangia seranimata]MDI2129739.1 LysR family transcriptional regulator [Yinghuangia seranimata]
MHARLDLNLLVALDVLLDEESVGGAAARLHLSEPAMSRTLGRIRKATGDPILVRAGRSMVPTPRALAMRAEVRALVEQARQLLGPVERPDPATLRRTFSVIINDGLVAAIGQRVFARIRAEAPYVTVRFLPEERTDTPVLREGAADLLVGSPRDVEPEARSEVLAVDRFVGVVRAGHPLTRGTVTPERFADADHLIASRRGRTTGPIDDALARLGLRRRVVGTVPSYASSLYMLLLSDAVGMTTEAMSAPSVRALGLRTFPIPLDLDPLSVVQVWHPRHDADGAHAWLRALVRDAVAEAVAEGPTASGPVGS